MCGGWNKCSNYPENDSSKILLNPTIYLCHNKLSHLLRFRNYVFYIWNTMTMEKIIIKVTVTIGNPIFWTLLIVVAIGVSRLSASISSKWSFDDLLKVPRLPLDPFGWNVYWFYKCIIVWKWVPILYNSQSNLPCSNICDKPLFDNIDQSGCEFQCSKQYSKWSKIAKCQSS